MSTTAYKIATSHFSRKTINFLAKKGIEIIGMTAINNEGDFAFSINDNGTGKMRTHLQVLEMAEALTPEEHFRYTKLGLL